MTTYKEILGIIKLHARCDTKRAEEIADRLWIDGRITSEGDEVDENRLLIGPDFMTHVRKVAP